MSLVVIVAYDFSYCSLFYAIAICKTDWTGIVAAFKRESKFKNSSKTKTFDEPRRFFFLPPDSTALKIVITKETFPVILLLQN
jgi:hypothetical protein